MFSVIFEVKPRAERFNEYLELARHLKPNLEMIDGFVDNERFESTQRKGWLLSLSTWRDEKSVVRWRTGAEQPRAQAGRSELFEDYHLRIADVIDDSCPPSAAPVRAPRMDKTEIGAAKYATLTEITPRVGVDFHSVIAAIPTRLGLQLGMGLVDHDVFSSIYNPGKLALLAAWQDVDAARSWHPMPMDGVQGLRHRVVRIVRDYGMLYGRESRRH